MDQQEMAAKFEQLLQDEAFVENLFSSETPEEAQTVLASQGIEMSIEEVTALGKAIADQSEGELSEEQLGDVAGGALVSIAGLPAIAFSLKVIRQMQLQQLIHKFTKLW